MESSPDILIQLQEIILPVVNFTLENIVLGASLLFPYRLAQYGIRDRRHAHVQLEEDCAIHVDGVRDDVQDIQDGRD
jgi:hypothetical protein